MESSLFVKNLVDVTGAESFLDYYIKNRTNSVVLEAEDKTIDRVSARDNIGNFDDILKSLNSRLDCTSNCIADAQPLVNILIDPLDSYIEFEEIKEHKFSIVDVLSCSYDPEVQKIKQLMVDQYIRLLVNTYKYKMMDDFYDAMKLPQTKYNIIYKLFLLTLKSVNDNVESCCAISAADMNTIIDNMASLPSFDFCKSWMDMHKLPCIFENVYDKQCILHNNKEYKQELYIHFEFHTKNLVLLKAANLQTK
ncbi:hypothetical protein HgNV_031 [Homarus gammarus nudivirus]|uniref:Uncharacterized protein n=1 Tax=Homarus gammarus nudivirus TaxID=2509616 RepID=A0A411HB68_9VIRU|nr:hypothetical protein KM727_gp31 [Homarus gammarus nudivirus]QBB28636.1 hypothetical protein HgNV_031 [Homarus gammarus nudivirus]